MLLPLVFGLAACSGEPISIGSSSTPEHASASDGPAASTATALKGGLLVRRKSDDGGLTYALVDVDSGALRQTIQFPGQHGTTFSYRAQAYSHDWTRHAVTVVGELMSPLIATLVLISTYPCWRSGAQP